MTPHRAVRLTVRPALFLGAALTFACLAGAAAAEKKTPLIEIVDFGIYTLSVTNTVKAPKVVSGERNIVSNVQLKEKTRKILAIPGRSFGYRYRIDPSLAGQRLTLRVTYPKLTNPATGKSATSEQKSFIALPSDRPSYDGYRFDHTWEMAEGTWTFEILRDGEVIARQSFKIIVAVN